MKILQLIPSLEGGGARRLMVDLSNEIESTHHVNVLSLYNPVEKNSYQSFLKKEVKISSLGKKPGFDFKILPLLYKTIKKNKPDVIHNHLGSFNYLMPLIPFLNNIPIVHTIHSDAFAECSNKVIRCCRKHFFKMGEITPVTISKESSNSFRKAYGKVKFEEIINGRKYPEKSEQYNERVKEIENLKFNESTKVFVNIGRISTVKNQLMLIEAFDYALGTVRNNAVLIIIGKANQKQENQVIQKKIIEIDKNHKNIHFLGYQENATDYLHVSDFFCLSSKYEGMPITLIESFAAGCVSLCTPVGGIPEMIKDLDQSLLSAGVSQDDYYNLLKKAMNIPEKILSQISEKSMKLFQEKYSIKYCSEQYQKLYRIVS